MPTNINYPVVTVFLLYIGFILLIGYLAARVVKNISDYILGGRNLSSALAALGAGASDMSQWLLMGMPGAVFVSGLNQIWILLGCSLGAFFNWQFIAKRLRIYTEAANNSLTMPAYLDNRFQDKSKILRRVTGVVLFSFFLFYSAAGFVAAGVVTQNIFHISYASATVISAAVIIIYTCIGGFVAISWIDFFQGSLMFFALLIVPSVTLSHLDGIDHAIQQLTFQGSHYFDAFYGYTWLGIVSLLCWGLGYPGQPHIIVRFMAVRHPKDIPLAKLICMTWMVLALYGALFTGLMGASYFHLTGKILENPETIFLVLADVFFNKWITGFLIAAVLSAIMSTVSAQLLLASSALTEDFYRDFVRPNAGNRELILVARMGVLIISLIGLFIALYSANSTILGIVAYAWSGLGASFGPVILLSLYWRSMTREAAIAGILVGAISVVIWELLGKYTSIEIFKLYSILPAFLLNMLTIYVISLFSKAPREIVEQFDAAMGGCSIIVRTEEREARLEV